jgi:iron(III) transport system substrate-binding protein
VKNLRRATVVALAAAGALALGACAGPAAEPVAPEGASDELQQLIEDAQQEGQLTLYGDGAESTLQAWTAGFTEEYGISVNILRAAGSELTQRFRQEQAAGQAQADIISSTDVVAMRDHVEQGYLAEYTPENADLWPEEQGEPGYFYPLQNGFFQTVLYNPDLLSEDEIELIREDPIEAAGDPVFAGRIAVGAPQASQQTAAFYYNLTEGQAADEYGWDSLEAIAENDPTVEVQTLTLLQNVIAGEYAVAVAVTDSLIASQFIQGAPVQFAYPLADTGGYFGTGVVENAPHPNAARLFMEWASSPEASELYTGITQTIPANSEVEDTRELLETDWYQEPELDDVWFDFVTDEDFLEASSADGDFLPRWSEVFGFNG